MEQIQTIHQLITCICYATDPSSTNKDVASTMLNNLSASSNGGSLLCIELLRHVFEMEENCHTNNEQFQIDNILFYSLTTLQKALSLRKGSECIVPYQFRLELRKIIYEKVLKSDLNGRKINGQFEPIVLPTYQRTKIGVVLSLLVQSDFPERWQTAFHELIQLSTVIEDNDVTNMIRKDIYLRTLDAFCDEIVEDTSVDRNTLIKDTVRGLKNELLPIGMPSEQSISAMILQSILHILKSCAGHIYNAHHFSSDRLRQFQMIPIQCLSVMKRFISWIDLSLALNDEVLCLLFTCINNAGPGDTEDVDGSLPSQLAVEALECLKEIISKGMEEQKKMRVIVKLDILHKIETSGINLVEIDRTHTTVVIKVAELVSMVGIELINYYATTTDQDELYWTSSKLEQLMPLFLKCFSYDDIDVSGAVIELASKLVMMVGSEQKQINTIQSLFQITSYIPNVLSIMFDQMKYPENFEFDYEDEDEAEEEIYRTELRKLNQSLVRSVPEVSLQFLCTSLSQLKTPLSHATTRDVEVVLRLIYHFCDGIRPSPGVKTVLKNPIFCEVLVALHKSDISMHRHREVIILYYDIAVRYSEFFDSHLEFLPGFLESITGTRGLQNQHPRVRSRSCYLFLKLVKSVGQHLRPYVESAIGGIQNMLSNQVLYSLHPEDSLYLFETIGLLLGRSNLDAKDEERFLSSIITPFLHDMENLIMSSNMERDSEAIGDKLAFSIASLAFLSKGFPKDVSLGVKNIFTETVAICLLVLESFPFHDMIRNKIMIYIQRMLLLLGSDMIPYMHRFFPHIISNCKEHDILDIGQMFYQLSLKFKSRAIPAINSDIISFLKRCYQLTPIDDGKIGSAFHLAEILSIKKVMFATVHQIVSSDCAAVFISSTNISSLQDVLSMVGDGAINITDPAIQRTCLQFFKELVYHWLNQSSIDNSLKYAFQTYLYDMLLPGVFESFRKPTFDINDAMQYRSVREFASILRLLQSYLSENDYENVLRKIFKQTVYATTSNILSLNDELEIQKQLKTMLTRN